MGGDLDEAVAIAAIHPELAGVSLVGEKHRLNGLVTDAGIFRGEIIPKAGGHRSAEEEEANDDLEGQQIAAAREDVGHVSSRLGQERIEERKGSA